MHWAKTLSKNYVYPPQEERGAYLRRGHIIEPYDRTASTSTVISGDDMLDLQVMTPIVLQLLMHEFETNIVRTLFVVNYGRIIVGNKAWDVLFIYSYKSIYIIIRTSFVVSVCLSVTLSVAGSRGCSIPVDPARNNKEQAGPGRGDLCWVTTEFLLDMTTARFRRTAEANAVERRTAKHECSRTPWDCK